MPIHTQEFAEAAGALAKTREAVRRHMVKLGRKLKYPDPLWVQLKGREDAFDRAWVTESRHSVATLEHAVARNLTAMAKETG